MKILLFDNHDSFTFNLAHSLRRAAPKAVVDIRKNDAIALEEVEEFDRIVLSPGPGLPAESGILLDLIREFASKKPILGICLGHQAIGEAFGAKLEQLQTVFHGTAAETLVSVGNEPLFNGMPKKIQTGRYHSWVISEKNFPLAELEITARDAEGRIMALRHRRFNVRGVQFHPESILTPDGQKMIKNWLKTAQQPT